MKNLLMILILLIASSWLNAQTLRTIKADAISPNVPTGNINITSTITLNSGTGINAVLDEDTLASDSEMALATQQSIKAYVDDAVSTIGGIGDVTLSGTAVNDILKWNGSAWVNSATAQLTNLGLGGVLDSSLILDTQSTTKGSRPCPSMSEAERDLVTSPATGSCVYNNTSNALNVYTGSAWGEIGGGGGASAIGDLTDVTIGATEDKQALMLNAGIWENRLLVIDDISDISTITASISDNTDAISTITASLPLYAALDDVTQTVTASAFIGDGSGLTGLPTPVSDHADLTNVLQATTGVTEGHVNDQAQTIAGAKTFSTSVTSPTMTATNLTVNGTATLTQPLTTIAAPTNYMVRDTDGVIKQAPVSAPTTGNLVTDTTGVVITGGTGAISSTATISIQNSGYSLAGLLNQTYFGEFDSKEPERFGYYNFETGSGISSWDVTSIATATFVSSNSSPLKGGWSGVFTNLTGSASESLCSPNFTVDLKSRGRTLGVELPYSYDGADNDIDVQLFDVTNSTMMGHTFIEAGSSKRISVIGGSQSTTAQVKVCFVIYTENNGKVLKLDDIVFTGNPIKTVELYRENNFSAKIANNGSTITISDDVGNVFASGSRTGTGQAVLTYTTNKFTSAPNITTTLSKGPASAAGDVTIHSESATGFSVTTTDAGGGLADLNFSVAIQNAPVDYNQYADGVVHTGTFPENVFSARIANNGTATVTSTNYDFIESVTRSSAGKIDIVWKSGFFTVAPSVNTVVEEHNGLFSTVAGITTSGCQVNTNVTAGSLTDYPIDIIVQRQGTDYKPLTGTIITPITQTMEVNVTSTAGYARVAASAAYQTRALYSLSGDVFGTLSANQITLSAGKYIIAPTIGSTSDANDLYLGIYNVTTSSYLYDKSILFHNSSIIYGSNSLTIPRVIELTETSAIEIRTKSGGAAANQYEYIHDFTITKLLGQ